MKKLKSLALVAIFASSMLYSPTAEAKRNSGNYINDDGCLVVWQSTTFLGITWSYHEDLFCDVVLEP